MTLFANATLTTAVTALVAGGLMTLAVDATARVAKRLGLSDTLATCLALALWSAFVLLLPVAGLLTDTFGPRPVLATGAMLGAVALAFLAMTTGFLGAVSGTLLLGNAGACLLVAANVLFPIGFAGTPLVTALSLGYVFFTVGNLLGPRLLGRLVERFEIRKGLGILALLVLLPALFASVSELETHPGAEAGSGSLAVLHRPEFWLLGLALFLYLPVEGFLAERARQFLAEIGQPERRAGWLVTGFWVALLVGRVFAALAWERGWVRPTAGPWLTFGLTVTAAVFLGNLAGARGDGYAAAVGLLVLGLLLGPVFPILVSALFDRFTPDVWGTALGGTAALGWFGARVIEPALAAYARRTTTRHALWVLVVVALLLALVLLVLGIARNLHA